MAALPAFSPRASTLLLTSLIVLSGCGAASAPRTVGLAKASSDGAAKPSTVQAISTPAAAPPSASAQQPMPAPPPAQDVTRNGGRHFSFDPQMVQMCRRDLAFANGDSGPGPGTARMEYGFMGTVDGGLYELDFQIVPWHGAGTYRFGAQAPRTTWLYLMTGPDNDAYLARGGTVTVTADGRSGTITTTVNVDDGPPVAILGPWSCGDAR